MENEEETVTVDPDGTSFLAWGGGTLSFPEGAKAFAGKVGAVAIRTHWKTGDVEILIVDGETFRWRRVDAKDGKVVKFAN